MLKTCKNELRDTNTVDIKCLKQLVSGLYKVTQDEFVDLLSIIFDKNVDEEAELILGQISTEGYKWTTFTKTIIKERLKKKGVNIDNGTF